LPSCQVVVNIAVEFLADTVSVLSVSL